MMSLQDEKLAALYMSIMQDGSLYMHVKFSQTTSDGISAELDQMTFETPFKILHGLNDPRMQDSLVKHLDSIHNEMSLDLVNKLLAAVTILDPQLKDIISDIYTINTVYADTRVSLIDSIIQRLNQMK
jgi:hypothetical protein